MANLKDVAKEAGVSVTLVSRILNQDQSLSAAKTTKEKVRKSAEKLNYTPSVKKKASVHKVNTPLAIGLIIFCSKDYEYEDEYFMAIRYGVESACQESGLNITTVIRQNQGPLEESFFNNQEGIIVVGHVSSDIVNQIYSKCSNIVFVDESPGNDKFDSVTSHFFNSTNQLMNYLFELSHREIGYIGGNEFIHSSGREGRLTGIENIEKLRFLPYKNVMKEHGYFREEHIYIGEWSTESGYELMKKALSKPVLPTAFMIASDPLAIGAIRALHEEGIGIPSHVSIVSFNDIKMARYINPPLTTVKIYTEEMGKSAVKLLCEQINGREIPVKLIHPCRMQIRESSGIARRRIHNHMKI